MSITVTIHAETGQEARQKMADLLGVGFIRAGGEPLVRGEGGPAASGQSTDSSPGLSSGDVSGQSSASSVAPAVTPEPKEVKSKRVKKADAEKPQISTGEERVGPEDDPEVAAQDAADEAAEVKTGELTHDDLRNAVGRYQAKFGLPAAIANINGIIGCKPTEVPATQEALAEAIAKIDAATAADPPPAPPAEPETPAPTKDDLIRLMTGYKNKFGDKEVQADGAKLLVDALGSPPAGSPYWTISLIVDAGRETLQKALDAWQAALDAEKRYGAA